MIKIFQGDFQSVQRDVNNWIEVYSPEILDFKQSMCSLEHNSASDFFLRNQGGTPESQVPGDQMIELA